MFFFSSADFFFKIKFLQINHQDHYPSVKQFGLDLGPNCSQRLLADDKILPWHAEVDAYDLI